jgi:hypothetical protein
MLGSVRARLLMLLAAAPFWAAADNEPPASCIHTGLQTSGPCVVWLAADAAHATASFDGLSAPRAADSSPLARVPFAAEPAPSLVSASSTQSASSVAADAATGLSFQGIPLGLWFTALVVAAYALRRAERVWPQPAATPSAVKSAFLSTEAGRL